MKVKDFIRNMQNQDPEKEIRIELKTGFADDVNLPPVVSESEAAENQIKNNLRPAW